MAGSRPRSARKPPAAQPVANRKRGEHELQLAGTAYRLRPSQTAVQAIETKCGSSLLTLVRDGNAGDLTLADLGIIACELIRAGAQDELTRNVGPERLAELIFEEGIAAATVRLTLCLADAASGGRTATGEAKPATA